uniref:SPAG6-like protein n=1 Tax=Marsilea vestita TaxID=59764 RepID=I7BAE0_MARVE|nr:SPAG6-like protein [Marsilea vestita]AFO37823.1 SPAG6-like protein [Marsilea vestita]
MATTRAILQVLDNYQKCKLDFVEAICELSTKEQNVEVLHSSGVLQFLKPLLLDTIPHVQQAAAFALGRMANFSEDLAIGIVDNNIHYQALRSLKELNRYNKKPAACMLGGIAKHNSQLAQEIVDIGSVEQIVLCLEEFEPGVKEVGCSAVGYIAKHGLNFAESVINAKAVPLLVISIQDTDLALRRASVLALAEIAKHGANVAQVVVDATAVPLLATLITHPDAKLKRNACYCLSSISKHSPELANIVVGAGIFPKIYISLKDADPQVRRNAAILIREVCKHTPTLAQIVVGGGGAAAIVENVTDTRGSERLPSIMTMGFIASFSETFADMLVSLNGIPPLVDALNTEPEDHIKSACVWSLGHIARHTSTNALSVAQCGALQKIVVLLLSPRSCEDLKSKCVKTLKGVIQKLRHLPALDALLQGPKLPEDLLKLLVLQLEKILENDEDGRTHFVTSGGFEKLQKSSIEPDNELKQSIEHINTFYPVEIVQYYSPNYPDLLLRKVIRGES